MKRIPNKRGFSNNIEKLNRKIKVLDILFIGKCLRDTN